MLRQPGLGWMLAGLVSTGLNSLRLRAGICALYRGAHSVIVLSQGSGPLTSVEGAPAAINAIPGRVSAPLADAAV